MLKFAIKKVLNHENLSEDEMMEAMDIIMDGKASGTQIGGLLTALRFKGETKDEILGSAKVMRNKAVKVDLDGRYAIDTCGTGGDGGKTFNISTAAAIIAAAAGVAVLKHGNRSVSSKCGSADVLEKLGIDINLDPDGIKRSVDKTNMGFMFAPNYHKAMKYAAGPRKELGVRTIFNVLGPLTNPANVKGQLLGVFDENLTETVASTLKGLGVERSMVVYGLGGFDEITLSDKTKVAELKDGVISEYYIDPHDYGFEYCNKSDIEGGDAYQNAEIIRNIFNGQKGPKRDVVLLNAGAAIYVGKKATNLKDGIQMAANIIDTGLANEKLNELSGINLS